MIWFNNLGSKDFIGYADFISPTASIDNVFKNIQVLNRNIFGGFNSSFLSSYIFSFSLPYYIIGILGLSSPQITMILISSLLFISQCSMFLFLKYLIKNKMEEVTFRTDIFALYGSILYGFSPFVAGILEPGHIYQLYSYAFFPLLLFNLDLFLRAKFNIRYLINLFLIFFITAPAYANIGILYLTFLIIFIYSFALIVYESHNPLTVFLKNILVYISAIISNLWWFLPFILNVKTALALNQESGHLTKNIEAAVKHATVNNLFLGRAENLFFTELATSNYSSILMATFFFLIVILSLVYLFGKRKNKYNYVLLFLLVAGAFISKGINAPYSTLFSWLYDHVTGFQIFRRPVSKFYWFFLLVLITSSILGSIIVLDKFRSRLVKGMVIFILTVFSLFLFYSMAITPALIPFNVPQYYFKAGEYLKNTHAQRIIVAPGFYGTYPTYDKTVSNYYGDDFLNYIWDEEILVPDSTDYSVNSSTKREVNRIMSEIVGGGYICDLTKRLRVSHIMVRKDYGKTAKVEGAGEELIKVLNTHPDMSDKKLFGSSDKSDFVIYKLKNECSSSLVVSPDLIDIKDVNDVTIQLMMKNFTDSTSINLLLNNDRNWKLLYMENDEKVKPLKLILGRYKPVGKRVDGPLYENSWKINKNELSDKSSHNFVIYYNTQNYLFYGLFGFTMFAVSAIAYFLYDRTNNKKGSQ